MKGSKMGKNKKEAQSNLLFALFLTTAFQFCFSDAKHLHNNMKIETKSHNHFGSSVVFPVRGDVFRTGSFYISMNIGNPPRTYFLDIDTGSDLTWVQCAAAPDAKLLKAPNSPYKPNNNAVSCNDRLCAFVNKPADFQCKALTDQCDYEVEYVDYGSSLGVLVRDSFPLRFTNGSVYRPTMAFGCGYDQEFSGPIPPPYVDGVLGLANGKSSLISQLRNLGLTRNVVGHCFSGQGVGHLFFGDDLIPSGIVWTPMLSNSLNHYLSGPVDLLFDGKILVAKGLSVVFDSGSTYTYLNSPAYQATLNKVRTGLTGKPLTAVKDGSLPVCWKGKKPFKSIDAVLKYFSPLVLSFPNGNNVRFVLPPNNYLIITSNGNVCLGILDGTATNLGHLNVIGDISMLDKLVVYDNEKQMIGWAPANCNRPLKF
ncbi:hypothetical protein F0562_028013 [Nyssa sinensis]|uniref:Aspartic proteinase Asp1 n=1 Tax=Nyssa sinensis TaxID=561372 RepID=A0A5J5BB58_9ASTE|nr:hypothetical protein F0562_028013 [Nyssa sinensis]